VKYVCIIFAAFLTFSAWIVIIEFYRARARKLGEMAANDFNELNEGKSTNKELYNEQNGSNSETA